MGRKILHIAILFLLCCIPAAAQKGDASVENSLMEAVSLFTARKYPQARKLLENLREKAPENDGVLYYLGLVSALQNDVPLSLECLEKAASLDPDNFWYKSRLALIYKAVGRTDDMIALYEEILEKHPEKTEISYELLDEYLRKGDAEKALKALADIEAVMGPDEQIARTRYDIYTNIGKPEEALAALERFNAEYSSPSILSMIGDSHLSRFEDSLALASYKEALSLDKNYVPALLGECEVYRTNGRTEEYFSRLGEFMDNPSVNSLPKTMYLSNIVRSVDPGFVRRNLGNFDGIVEKCLAAEPDDSTALMTAGLWYYSTERRDKGIRLLKDNVEKYPSSVPAAATYIQAVAATENWENLRSEASSLSGKFPKENGFIQYANMACYNLKDYRGILDNCNRLLAASPDSATTLYALSSIGDMEHLLGNDKEAYKAYRKALKINPSYAPVLNNYAWYLCQEGKSLKKALEMSRKTLDSEPDNPTYLDTYGWILHLLGRDRDAKPVFKHAMLYGGKDESTLLDHYAEVLFNLGEYDLAKVYWGQAASKAGEDAAAIREKAERKLKSVGK